jgi:hypothetical protein
VSERLTIELLEHALHGARAAAAGHGDVELVVVLGHFENWGGFDWVVRLVCGCLVVDRKRMEAAVVIESFCVVLGNEQECILREVFTSEEWIGRNQGL